MKFLKVTEKVTFSVTFSLTFSKFYSHFLLFEVGLRCPHTVQSPQCSLEERGVHNSELNKVQQVAVGRGC